jgi:hypothetical protein
VLRRVGIALFLLLLAAGAVYLLWPEPRESQAAPVREMAGPGYIPPGAPTEPPAAPEPREGAIAIDFDLLAAFDYDPEVDLIPDEVLALDGKRVELRGVMYYAVEDPERVTEFYSMPNHMICCFGIPRSNEVVEVILRPDTHTQYLLEYFLIRGTLHVGAVRDEEDRVLCLYRITDAAVEVLQ